MDARTGTILFERGADVRRPPASTTKILTAVLVLERLQPDTLVSISARASAQRSGSAIGLEPGERWRAEDLLRALMLASANDAAVALAEAVAGSVERFADLMNQKARHLGARHSTFVVPHGLYDPGHLTTARDLALISRDALRHPAFAALARQQVFTWTRHGVPPRVVVNRNKLLWRLAGADGVKTGWIPQSGQCLVASATRGGRQLIAVVLNSPDVFGDAARLLESGFADSRLLRVATRQVVLARLALRGAQGTIALTTPEDVDVVLPRGAVLRWMVQLSPDLVPPVRRGAVAGDLLVYADGRLVARRPVVAADDVAAWSVWRRAVVWMRSLVGGAPPVGHGG
jgi:D-alanyl-D-alanine carboxypeptidase (penicillin-binding protein 5/6)